MSFRNYPQPYNELYTMAMLVPLLSSTTTTICFIQFVCILVHNHSCPFSVPYVLICSNILWRMHMELHMEMDMGSTWSLKWGQCMERKVSVTGGHGRPGLPATLHRWCRPDSGSVWTLEAVTTMSRLRTNRASHSPRWQLLHLVLQTINWRNCTIMEKGLHLVESAC